MCVRSNFYACMHVYSSLCVCFMYLDLMNFVLCFSEDLIGLGILGESVE